MRPVSTRHFLKFFIRTIEAPLVLEVEESASKRLDHVLRSTDHDSDLDRCFYFDTIDNRAVAINLRFIQAVNILWEPNRSLDPEPYEGDIEIKLRDRTDSIHTMVEEEVEIADFFASLENGLLETAFPCFEDEDGEMLFVALQDIIYVIAPKGLADEGHRIRIAELEGTDAEDYEDDE